MQREYTVYPGNEIGGNIFIGHHALIRQNNKIGNNVKIGSFTEVAFDCVIEDNVSVHSHCFIAEGSVLKRKCWIGPRAMLINDMYPQSNNKNKKAPTICEGAIIGANSVIMPGVTVGKNALIGAGSVVTKDIPDNEVWVGNPATFLKKKDDLNAYPVV